MNPDRAQMIEEAIAASREARRAKARPRIALGAALFVGGLILWAGTCLVSPSSDDTAYVVALSAVLNGVIRFGKGFKDLPPEDQARMNPRNYFALSRFANSR